MNSGSNFDVVVVGAGAAGLTAAIGLARAGFVVTAVEAAPFPGAENWSGCVYFCENLAHPDILGAEGVEALAWERRLVERGFFACDGYSLLGMKYRDPQAFRHCYTVLRPIYDHHMAQLALRNGVALLNNTTVESLIRDNGRIIGVCTNHGPLYADLVFLAEGDASHLVTREGYERFTDQREAPKFLQGIKQVIDLPEGAIERLFGIGPEEGAAYEILLRNATHRGQGLHLNMGGFVYTNRQSLSLGLVLPAEHLRDSFQADPNLLMEWFLNLPALRPWVREGKRGVFGAKVIRGGGARDIPNLIDDGLAIGGAASAIGIDFPYPNFTGPATAMGLLISQAASRIRAAGKDFTRENLRRLYLEPLQQSHYWQDVEFLRNWPGYVKRTQVFFGRNLDLLLGSTYIWTRSRRWFPAKWINWLRLVLQVAGPGHWREMRNDARHLLRALRLREVVSRPALGKLMLDGTVNALRDLAGSPRPNVPPAGVFHFHYSIAGGTEPVGYAPRIVRRWFRRMAPVLAAAARGVYVNDDTPLSEKLPSASQLLVRQVNMLDVLLVIITGVVAGIAGTFISGWRRLARAVRGGKARPPRGIYPQYARAAQEAVELSSDTPATGQNWDERLGTLAYQTARASHIHVYWPTVLQEKDAVADAGLWHVCPAHVFEARRNPHGQLQVVVNFENCIKCETCWRTSELVDWGRDGLQRFIYPVHSPVAARLLDAMNAPGSVRPVLPRALDHWEDRARRMTENLQADSAKLQQCIDAAEIEESCGLLERLERKLANFDEALAKEPRNIDRARGEYLEMLARYAQQLALRILDGIRDGAMACSVSPGLIAAHDQLQEAAAALLAKAEERSRRTWERRFAWAAADGRQLRFHQSVGLRRLLDVLNKPAQGTERPRYASRPWLRAEDDEASVAAALSVWRARLDGAFPPTVWRDLDRGAALSTDQDAVLRDLIAQVPVVNPADKTSPLHAPLRKALLAELGRRDPALAFRVASHLWARDLARLRMTSSSLARAAECWTRGDEWGCFAALPALQAPDGKWQGEALFVPARGVHSLLLLVGDQLVLMPADHAGLRIEPLATLGLRGAGLCRVVFDGLQLPASRVTVDGDRLYRAWQVQSSADLTSIAFGMADQLCNRAMAHATSRVQFPGLFHDEEAHDTIGKFGAVKKMVAQMAARRYLIETLDHALSPTDFSSASVERAGLLKALAADALGTSPGSLSYNAGQIFGGMGYSEDDILSKFYRDAAAWRYLGSANADYYRKHGEQLLRSWQADGRKLASLDQEAQLFDEVAQRKALQPELDGVRVLRSGLRGVVNDWQKLTREQASLKQEANGSPGVGAQAEFIEQLARQDAHLLAGKALLLRTHARLEHGLDSEIEVALLRVLFLEIGNSLDEFEALVRQHTDSLHERADRPLVDPSAGRPVTTYADYLAAECPYDSGDFLITPIDVAQPRFVPEMIEADPALATRNREFRELFSSHFGRVRADNLPFERHIEREHRPDADDLDFCRQHGFFRMPIPRELGGAGRPKVDYYLLTTNAQRFADVAISLTIQANTSIGTTPILLARDTDLPKARKDIDGFLGDSAWQNEIQQRLEKLLGRLPSAGGERLKSAIEQMDKQLQQKIFRQSTLRVLLHRFARAWEQTLAAARAFDLPALQARMKEAVAEWKDACAKAQEVLHELDYRLAACDLFLRWIAYGQISAFALTEPSAGSDTARVATRARLRSVAVEVEQDGVLRFVPAGGKENRYLLDARRLEFRAEGAYYCWSDGGEPALIHFDEYDYETDAPGGQRYYVHGSRTVHISDVAQLRERDGKLWYDYWELNGAKMWITNGRMAGVFCLYAKTEEGITGFMVDRHAEGLVVGKDEAKMGQLGSPTNELALQAVRVPRESVLGLEGRGQVNALETLNVGRAGLAIMAMAQMEGVIEASRTFAQQKYGGIPEWATWRLQRMEEDCFTAEALAHEVVGRFEHSGTRSVRMESAISKLLVSEVLHRVIELAEDVYGLAGQTQMHLLEKRKRDARILNIYEGTNEVQRFLILKDLAGEVVPRWSQSAAPPLPGYLGQAALTLEALKSDFRQKVQSALDVFGHQIWQNPNLQTGCFLLSEAAAWIKACDSTLVRLAWLERQTIADEDTEPSPRIELGRRAALRCQQEVRQRLSRFDEELAHLRRGYYAAEVRAAALLFDRLDHAAQTSPLASQITEPLSILVIVEPSPGKIPQPQVAGGRLMESYLTLNDADRSALETALRLREQATAPVMIEVAAVGPRRSLQALREALSLGVDRARLILTDYDGVSPDSAAGALASVLAADGPFDLILAGMMDAANGEGIIGRLTAEALGVAYAGRTHKLVIHKSAKESNALLAEASGPGQRERSLPVAASVEAGLPLRSFNIHDYLKGLSRPVEVERWPKCVVAHKVTLEHGINEVEATGMEQLAQPMSPERAAAFILDQAGVGNGSSTPIKPFDGLIEDILQPVDFTDAVVAIIAADDHGTLHASGPAVLSAASLVASSEARTALALVLVGQGEASQRRAVKQVLDVFQGTLVLLASERAGKSPDQESRLLIDCWALLTSRPHTVLGEAWAEDAIAALSRKNNLAGPAVFRVRRVYVEDDRVIIESSRSRGKLRVRQVLMAEHGTTFWISMSPEAVAGKSGLQTRSSNPRLQRWAPRIGRSTGHDDMQHLLGELKRETGLVSLADADFIIDIGFGVANRDIYEAVIEPLERALRALGVQNLALGGSRKVTEELHLLPVDRQIGQSGVSVNPQILLAIGISGAPQHVGYIGSRAIILAFNRDPEAPLMTLNQRQARPRVYPIVGDLFETIPAFVAALAQETIPEVQSKTRAESLASH